MAVVAPRLDQFMVSVKAAELIARAGAAPSAVAVAGYHEPSIVFLVGTKIKLAGTGAEAADFLTKTPRSVALIEDAALPEFQNYLTRENFSADAIGSVKGLNYSKKATHITLTLSRLRKIGP